MQCSPGVVEVQGSRWHYATDSGESLQIREEKTREHKTVKERLDLRERLHPQLYFEWIDICGQLRRKGQTMFLDFLYSVLLFY